MDEILASIRRIIESGDERNGTRARPPQSIVPDHRLELDVPARDEAPKAEAFPDLLLPSFEVSAPPPQSPPEAASEDRDGEDAGREENEAQGESGFDPAHAEASEADRETVEVDEDEDETYRDASELDDWQPEAFDAEETLREVGDDDASSVVPAAENENDLPAATAEQFPAAEASVASRELAFEFDDDAFEAELRNSAWMPAIAPQPAAAARMEAPAPFERIDRPAAAEMPDSVIEGASALLSAQAGDQVAKAFDDLAHAIRDGQMRSMEEMTREMLRPMLQEWLDDNLPRIVERLVRDEIERLSRGPRR